MPKLAIVLGVHQYRGRSSLPAALNDANLVHSVLQVSGNYEEILFVPSEQTTSESVKHHLTAFVQKHRSRTDVEEVFFYFSGHGQQIDDEFYYVLSDYDDARRNKTSLKNSELDGFLRTLRPALAIKVVDACNAGVQYVKDAGNLSSVIQKGAKENFTCVYFMFSSLADQPSFCDSSLSFFTKSFLTAVANFGRPEIRYRDIIDQITDDFAANPEQRPFFVIQGDNTELFGTFSAETKATLQQDLAAIPQPGGTPKADHGHRPSLAYLIKERAKDYLADADIATAASKIPTIAEQFPFSADIKEIFKLQVTTADTFEAFPNPTTIGKWVADSKGGYLARPITRVEEYEDYPNTIHAQSAKLFGGDPGPKVRKTRNVYSGFERAWSKPPFCRVKVSLLSKYPNVANYVFDIVFILSSRDIRYFYAPHEFWGSPSDVSGIKREYGPLKSTEGLVRDLLDDASSLLDLLREFEAYVTERLKQAAGLPPEAPAAPPQTS